MRLRSIPQVVSHRLAPYRAAFNCKQAKHFNVWGWLLVTLIIAGSGRVKEFTRLMPARLAYWTTLRFIQAQVWDEQALLELLVGDLLYCLPEPPEQPASIFALKQRFIEEAYQEQFGPHLTPVPHGAASRSQ